MSTIKTDAAQIQRTAGKLKRVILINLVTNPRLETENNSTDVKRSDGIERFDLSRVEQRYHEKTGMPNGIEVKRTEEREANAFYGRVRGE
jgi:hypothetical protein